MAQRKTSPLKKFRKRVEYHIKQIEDTAGFYSDSEWITLILGKIQELSDPVDVDQLALLGALIEVWGTDRGVDADLDEMEVV